MADDSGFQFVRAQIDPEGYFCVAVRQTTVDAPEVIGAFLDSIDPAWLEDQALTLFPETSPGRSFLDVLKMAVDPVVFVDEVPGDGD
jgi:hypothetical protein